MGTIDNDWDEEYSVIGDKVEVDFLDFEDDKSLHSFDLEEGPVVITKPFPFVNGKPQSALVGETSTDSIEIRNTTAEPVELWSIRIFSANPEDSYILSVIKPPTSDADVEAARRFVGSDALEDTVIQPGRTFKIWLSCKPKEIGLHTGIVHFDLGDEKVERVAFLLADDTVSQSLNSRKPYSRAPSRTRKPISEEFVAGNRPARATTHVFRNKLPQFPIPLSIREIVESKQVPDVIMEGLNDKNYSRYFSMLIAMEEIHLEQEMRAHDMECVSMRRKGYFFLALVVPGLAERRPSLVPGDYIFVQNVNEYLGDDTRQYQGYIHRVEADEICLKFDRDLHIRHQDTDLYNVSFTYNRINMRRLYQAVQAAENLGPELLFPSESSNARVIKTSSFVPLNPNLNDEQARSVKMILGCKGGPPYVIYGPPGTGKTMTMIEAILQIYTTRKEARLLICASSNSAADHVLEKLLSIENVDIKGNEIFRLNAPSRAYDDMKPDFIRFCYFEDMVFACPPLMALLRYRIIISTYMSASLLYAEGIRKGHFSEIFLDEAGQASEPEMMVPISNLCVKDTLIVLAGDPKQLGPVIYSRTAESYGMGKSFLDRLFECEYYGSGNENYVTKLVKNYRCHPAILELPSKLFYNNELIACKEDSDSSLYDSFDIPNKAFPVYFVGIQGCDEREGSNPSWFNRIEASKVTEIIRKLMMCADLDENDVGVITPYRQQVLKIKKALESVEILDVKVGSVEQFQGQERKVIIISTVRSTVKHNEFDRVHNLGFLSNPRRFNVAITRAGSLLIIVGNPHIIAKDPNWDKLLRYCADNGSYQGCPLPEPENHYSADEAPGYDGDQQMPILHSDGAEWGDAAPNQHNTGAEWDDVPKQYTNDVEWGDTNQYSNDVEWGGDTHNQYSNEEWGDATAQTYTGGPKRGNTRPYSNDHGWGGDTHNQYNNEEWGDATAQTYSGGPKRGNTRPYSYDHGWGGDTHNQYNNEEWGDGIGDGSWKDYPEKQSNEWDAVPPGSGWDAVPYEEPSRSTKLPPPHISHATGWDDVSYEEPSSSTKLPPPHISHATGWDDVPYEEPSSSTKLPPPRISHTSPRISHATGWDDVPYKKPSSSTKRRPSRISRATGWDD